MRGGRQSMFGSLHLLIGVVAASAGCGRTEGTAEPPIKIETLAPAVLAAGSQSADPSLAVDPATGELLLAWAGESGGVWNLYLARSSDAGGGYTPPRQVNDLAGDVHPHAEGAPRLVAADGVLALFWNNQYPVAGRAFGAADLRFSRSLDGGESWSPASDLQDDPGGVLPGSNTFHGAAWDGGTTLAVAWLDGRDRDARRIARGVAAGVSPEEAMRSPESYATPDDPHDGDAAVYAALSYDLGATWEPTNRRIQGGLCPCCRITLATNPSGQIHGVWRQDYPGSIRDPAFHRIEGPEDGSIRIHADNWLYPGCPHSGPALSFDPGGTAHVAWYTGAEGGMGVHYARLPSSSEAFLPPVPIISGEAVPIAHPSIAALPDGGAVVAHNVSALGDRVITLSGITPQGVLSFQEEIPGSEGGTHPQIALLPDGRLIVAWTRSELGLQRIGMARVTVGPMGRGGP